MRVLKSLPNVEFSEKGFVIKIRQWDDEMVKAKIEISLEVFPPPPTFKSLELNSSGSSNCLLASCVISAKYMMFDCDSKRTDTHNPLSDLQGTEDGAYWSPCYSFERRYMGLQEGIVTITSLYISVA